MSSKIPKLALIHDMVGIGRCCMGVQIPIISVMGVQAIPLATAVLSSHFGWTGPIYMQDMTEFLGKSFEHYEAVDFKFDGIVTGFLASKEQMEITENYLKKYDNGIRVIDPVMAEGGVVYPSHSKEMIEKLKSLLQYADVITPNQSEAFILADKEYTKTITLEKALELCEIIAELGPKNIIITGAKIDDGNVYNILYNTETKEMTHDKIEYIDVNYPGTGDMFVSIVASGMLKGASIRDSLNYAAKFISHTIKETYASGNPPMEGLFLETNLKWLFDNNL